jgi:hypothetical protein
MQKAAGVAAFLLFLASMTLGQVALGKPRWRRRAVGRTLVVLAPLLLVATALLMLAQSRHLGPIDSPIATKHHAADSGALSYHLALADGTQLTTSDEATYLNLRVGVPCHRDRLGEVAVCGNERIPSRWRLSTAVIAGISFSSLLIPGVLVSSSARRARRHRRRPSRPG